MKSLNQTELAEFISWAFPQVQGAQLQDIWTDGTGIALDLYARGLFQIWIDLRPAKVFLVLLAGNKIRKRQKVQRPVVLFLQSHAKNLYLSEMQLKPGYGRVVSLRFEKAERSCDIEIEMIPNAMNLHVKSVGKSLSWSKPKSLEANNEEKVFPVSWQNWDDYVNAYCEWRWPQASALKAETTTNNGNTDEKAAIQDPRVKNWQKDLEKKEKALRRLEELLQTELSVEAEERWRQFGESLKWKSEADPEYQDLWTDKKDLAWNRENAFHNSKSLKSKREGGVERAQDLATEIEEIKKKIQNPETAPQQERNAQVARRGTDILRKTESKGRTLNLPSGLQVIMGKSGRDNLAVLRQARAWDLWLHLKDEAAAHAILFRDKNQKVSHTDIEAAAQWLYSQSSTAVKGFAGGNFEILVVECRFVKPIKGDKLGRVTYQSPSVYSFAAKRNS